MEVLALGDADEQGKLTRLMMDDEEIFSWRSTATYLGVATRKSW